MVSMLLAAKAQANGALGSAWCAGQQVARRALGILTADVDGSAWEAVASWH